MKELKLALMGFGNVGKAFVKMLDEKREEIRETYDTEILITAICTGSHGSACNKSGLNIKQLLAELETENRFRSDLLEGKSSVQAAEECEYDVLIEMTPLNIFTGQPATDHIRAALKREKDAITANKGPIAWHYRELKELALKNQAAFFYETVVMDGTPVFNLKEHTLKMAKVSEISGILNSTTNFILNEMAKDTPEDEIMRMGREAGFIEADPRMDIEGYDAAAKITALLNVLMDADITPDQVERKGIEDITRDDIKDAASRGRVIKLVASGTRDEDGRVHASVKPVEVERTDILSTISSTTSIVSITTDLMGKISVVEHDPEIEQTAYGVFSDLIRVIEFRA